MSINFHGYSYTLLRYVHDTITGEFVNVGLVLFSKNQNFAGIRCLDSTKRITGAFPGANGHKVKSVLLKIEKQFEASFSSDSGQLPFNRYETALDIARQVLPQDDSSLQWSENKTGRCVNLNDELDRMFHRLVEFYSDEHIRQRRDEKDIWKSFSADLRARNIEQYFAPTTVSAKDDEVKFDHAWKNGKWHCIQPLSFDYTTAEYIKDKAHKWLGHITSVSASNNTFKLYFLIGEPANTDLKDAFDSAMSILEKIPGEKMLFNESEKVNLLDILEQEVKAHYSGRL